MLKRFSSMRSVSLKKPASSDTAGLMERTGTAKKARAERTVKSDIFSLGHRILSLQSELHEVKTALENNERFIQSIGALDLDNIGVSSKTLANSRRVVKVLQRKKAKLEADILKLKRKSGELHGEK